MSERKARKPLIERGSVLGEQPDILSSVLNAYADKTGQAAPFAAAAEPTPETTHDPEERAREETTEEARARETLEPKVLLENPERRQGADVSKTARQPADKPARPSRQTRPKKGGDAQEEAARRAETPKRLCSYRIPEALDDWLEEHAFEHRRQGLTKQDLVAQAIQLLIVAKGQGDVGEEGER